MNYYSSFDRRPREKKITYWNDQAFRFYYISWFLLLWFIENIYFFLTWILRMCRFFLCYIKCYNQLYGENICIFLCEQKVGFANKEIGKQNYNLYRHFTLPTNVSGVTFWLKSMRLCFFSRQYQWNYLSISSIYIIWLDDRDEFKNIHWIAKTIYSGDIRIALYKTEKYEERKKRADQKLLYLDRFQCSYPVQLLSVIVRSWTRRLFGSIRTVLLISRNKVVI